MKHVYVAENIMVAYRVEILEYGKFVKELEIRHDSTVAGSLRPELVRGLWRHGI